MFVDDEQERGQTECPNVSCKAARYTDNATGVPVETHTQLSLAKQLGNFLTQQRNVNNINAYREERQSSSGSYKDVFDGSAWKNNQDLEGDKMLSLALHADAFSPFKRGATGQSMTLLMVTILDLSPELRYCTDNI